MYNILRLPLMIDLGISGTNRQNIIEIDVSAWREKWSDATFNIFVVRPTETADNTYPADTVLDGNVLRWTIHYADVEKVGNGWLEVHASRVGTDELYAKSAVVRTIVAQSATGEAGETPEVAQPWTQRVEQAASIAEAAAQRAERAATHSPIIDVSGYWALWNVELGAYVVTEYPSQGTDGQDGFSPTVTIETIEGGHRVTITDKSGAHIFDVMDGQGGGGSGTVKTVNNIQPDTDGNVQLSPANVGAATAQGLTDEMTRATTAEAGLQAQVTQQSETIATKLAEPSSGLAVGKYFRISSIDENGHAVLEAVDAPEGKVEDVLVGDASAVQNKVAKLEVYNESNKNTGTPVLVRTTENYGFTVFRSSYHYLALQSASSNGLNLRSQVGAGGGRYGAVTPSNLDHAVKAAMSDGVGAAWTDAEKSGAWQRLTSIKSTMDSVAVAGAAYYLGELTALTITMPTDALLGQSITVVFSSGATACTLTCDLTGFDFVPKANETNKLTFTLIHKADATVTGDTDKWIYESKEF